MSAKQAAVTLVQYIVLRGDLLRTHGWPLGAMVAQGCHASTAVLHAHKDDPCVVEYLGDLERMHKVVLEGSGEAELRGLASSLQEVGVAFKLWVEQPENVPTCLATVPGPKASLQGHFKRLKLFK